MADHTDYDKNPEALAWARGKIEAVADRYQAFADRATAEGYPEGAAVWQKCANAVRQDLIGTPDGEIASFDERLPVLEERSGASAARHPQVTFTNAITSCPTEYQQRCYPDAETAYEAAVTERPYNNTSLSLGWCTENHDMTKEDPS